MIGELRHRVTRLGGSMAVNVIKTSGCPKVLIERGLPVPRACRAARGGEGSFRCESYRIGSVQELRRNTCLSFDVGRIPRNDSNRVVTRRVRVANKRHHTVTLDRRDGIEARRAFDEGCANRNATLSYRDP
jgi:hypothetical protein